MKYDNFFFPADNLDASKHFYQNTLRLDIKFDFSEHGMIAFKVGEEEAAIILKAREKFPKAQPAVWITVENVHDTYAALCAQNVSFLSEPFRIRTGWAVECHDPSGNLIGFTDYRTE